MIKNATFSIVGRHLCYFDSKRGSDAHYVFSVSRTRIKYITEHESFRPVCLLADVKAETSFQGGSSSLLFLILFRPTSAVSLLLSPCSSLEWLSSEDEPCWSSNMND